MNRILVLGGRSDIGRAIAYQFAKSGFDILLAGKNPLELSDDANDLQIRHGINAKTIRLDVLDFDSHDRFIEEAGSDLAGVVCVVGYMGNQILGENDFKEARRIIDTNFTGCVSVLNRIAKLFELQKSGFIIGVSSVAGDRGRQSNYLYGSAKAGFSAYLSGLRNRLAKSNVSVITVKPGFVNTKMTSGLNLPPLLTAQPEEVASDILKAVRRKKDIVYTKWFWKYIMVIIGAIPEKLFKRMKL